MCSARDNAALPTLGFPIRASACHWLFSASPRLIAAVHALHRLLVPRHPPHALTILTVIGESLRDSLARNLTISRGSPELIPARRNPQGFLLRQKPSGFCPYPCHWLLCSFQGPRKEARSLHVDPDTFAEPPAASRSLKTQQHGKSAEPIRW